MVDATLLCPDCHAPLLITVEQVFPRTTLNVTSLRDLDQLPTKTSESP